MFCPHNKENGKYEKFDYKNIIVCIKCIIYI